MERRVDDYILKLLILENLIFREKATTQYLIELTELNNLYKNPYAALTKPLQELRHEKYINIQDTKLKITTGGPKSVYFIEKNKDTIAKLYTNYPELKELLYKTDWVLDTVANERFPSHFSEEHKGILKQYLGSSPSYFKLALLNDQFDKIVARWTRHLMSSITKNIPPSYKENGGKPVLPSFCYFKFFEVCVFFDMMQGCLTESGREFLEAREQYAPETLE